MTNGFRRGLLPTLFALIALLLAVQQASASMHSSDSSVGMVHVDQHVAQDERCALHVTGCCSVSVGMFASPSCDVAYVNYRAAFELDAGSSPSYASRRSKQFRPPRLR